MKSKFYILFIVSLFLPLLNWRTGNNLMSRVAAQQNQQCEQIARVDRIEGEASLIPHQGASKPLQDDQILCKGDKIDIAAEATLTIICNTNNQSQRFPISGESQEWGVANLCPPITLCDGKDCVRGEDQQTFHIIYPSNTALQINNPRFRWSSVSGATQYTVKLEDFEEVKIWEKTVNQNEMDYPSKEAKLLEFGKVYILTIEALRNENLSVITKETELKLLNEDDIRDVKADAERLKQAGPEAISLLMDLYRQYKLKADAIAYLEELVEQGKQSATIYRYLGDLYWEVERPLKKIENAYLNGLKLATNDRNKGNQALIYARLGEINKKMGNTEKAREMFNNAINCYEEAEDMKNAENVRRFLSH